MEIMKTGVKVVLTVEEEEAFTKVLDVLERLKEDNDVDLWVTNLTESGCGIEEIYEDLHALFRACD